MKTWEVGKAQTTVMGLHATLVMLTMICGVESIYTNAMSRRSMLRTGLGAACLCSGSTSAIGCSGFQQVWLRICTCAPHHLKKLPLPAGALLSSDGKVRAYITEIYGCACACARVRIRVRMYVCVCACACMGAGVRALCDTACALAQEGGLVVLFVAHMLTRHVKVGHFSLKNSWYLTCAPT